MALLWALLFVIITSGLVISHTSYMAARRGERDARYNRATMADTFARSGLQDAVGWFHRRSNQPITVFDPVYDPSGSPPRIDTIDPAIGLVREFEINGSLWGRYEVRKAEATDISAQRGDLPPGSAWELGVRAYVYRKRDDKKAFDQAPNQMVATTALRSELRWLQVNPPVPAAICAESPDRITIGPRATISGGDSIALGYRDPATMATPPTKTTPTITFGASVSGTPKLLAAPVYDAAANRVFAMRLDELRGYSDAVIDTAAATSGWASLWAAWWSFMSGHGTPTPPPSNVLTIDNRLLYTEGLQLDGEMVLTNSLLVVDGDLTASLAHKTRIDGVVYVTGDIRINTGELELNGLLIGRGKIELGKGFFGSVKVTYDANMVETVRTTVGKYRSRRNRSPGQ